MNRASIASSDWASRARASDVSSWRTNPTVCSSSRWKSRQLTAKPIQASRTLTDRVSNCLHLRETRVIIRDEVVLTGDMESLNHHSSFLRPSNNRQCYITQYCRMCSAALVNVWDASSTVEDWDISNPGSRPRSIVGSNPLKATLHFRSSVGLFKSIFFS